MSQIYPFMDLPDDEYYKLVMHCVTLVTPIAIEFVNGRISQIEFSERFTTQAFMDNILWQMARFWVMPYSELNENFEESDKSKRLIRIGDFRLQVEWEMLPTTLVFNPVPYRGNMM